MSQDLKLTNLSALLVNQLNKGDTCEKLEIVEFLNGYGFLNEKGRRALFEAIEYMSGRTTSGKPIPKINPHFPEDAYNG